RLGRAVRPGAGDHRHAPFRHLDGDLDDTLVLVMRQRGRLARGSDRNHSVRAFADLPVDEAGERLFVDAAIGTHWRDKCDQRSLEHTCSQLVRDLARDGRCVVGWPETREARRGGGMPQGVAPTRSTAVEARMRLASVIALAALALLTAGQRAAAGEFANPMPSVRADAWPTAEAAVADYLDPVARKLVTYFRVLAPGAATVAEIDAFMADNPNWPAEAQLDVRRDEALAAEADDATVLADCKRRPPTHAPAQLRCAAADLAAGQAPGAAARQVARLDAVHKREAEARLALQHKQDTALALVTALPAGPVDPGLFLDRARYLRMANRDADALALWTEEGAAAQQA